MSSRSSNNDSNDIPIGIVKLRRESFISAFKAITPIIARSSNQISIILKGTVKSIIKQYEDDDYEIKNTINRDTRYITPRNCIIDSDISEASNESFVEFLNCPETVKFSNFHITQSKCGFQGCRVKSIFDNENKFAIGEELCNVVSERVPKVTNEGSSHKNYIYKSRKKKSELSESKTYESIKAISRPHM